MSDVARSMARAMLCLESPKQRPTNRNDNSGVPRWNGRWKIGWKIGAWDPRVDDDTAQDNNARMALTDHDHRHFQLVGEIMAAKKDDQRREALRSTPAERVALGFQLGARKQNDAIDAALDERADAQIGLAKRGRFLRR